MALASILLLYLGIGVLAALGTVTITRQRFSPRAEHRFFALLLLPVAAFYFAFISYFHSPASLPIEIGAMIVVAALGLLGTRLPLLIVVGFVLHGAWDLVHEVVAFRQPVPDGTSRLTPIPLAYGVFCAAYDWCIAGYIALRRHHWPTGAPQ
jgi:hypothetical protein